MNLKPGPKVSSDQNPGNLLYIYKKNNIYIYQKTTQLYRGLVHKP